VQELRRPFDIREEERDRPSGKIFAHNATSSGASEFPSSSTSSSGDRPLDCASVPYASRTLSLES
jgi:hypothetical protein